MPNKNLCIVLAATDESIVKECKGCGPWPRLLVFLQFAAHLQLKSWAQQSLVSVCLLVMCQEFRMLSAQSCWLVSTVDLQHCRSLRWLTVSLLRTVNSLIPLWLHDFFPYQQWILAYLSTTFSISILCQFLILYFISLILRLHYIVQIVMMHCHR